LPNMDSVKEKSSFMFHDRLSDSVIVHKKKVIL